MTYQEEQHKVELQAKLQQMEMKMVQGKQAGDDFGADRYGTVWII